MIARLEWRREPPDGDGFYCLFSPDAISGLPSVPRILCPVLIYIGLWGYFEERPRSLWERITGHRERARTVYERGVWINRATDGPVPVQHLFGWFSQTPWPDDVPPHKHW